MANQQNIIDSSSVWDIDFNESKNFRDLYASLETKYNAGHRDGIKKVALNMLSMNMEVSVIAFATGLTIEQIEDLKKQIG